MYGLETASATRDRRVPLRPSGVEISSEETNCDETSPLMVALPSPIPPAFTTTGAHPFFLVDHASTPSSFSVSSSGCIGLLLMLESPVSTTKPSGAAANADVMNLSVVPEFSTFTTSSGVSGLVPSIVSVGPDCSTLAPIALHAAIVALVSREKSAFEIFDSPSDEARHQDRPVRVALARRDPDAALPAVPSTVTVVLVKRLYPPVLVVGLGLEDPAAVGGPRLGQLLHLRARPWGRRPRRSQARSPRGRLRARRAPPRAAPALASYP